MKKSIDKFARPIVIWKNNKKRETVTLSRNPIQMDSIRQIDSIGTLILHPRPLHMRQQTVKIIKQKKNRTQSRSCPA